jgi:hypothetical protein
VKIVEVVKIEHVAEGTAQVGVSRFGLPYA